MYVEANKRMRGVDLIVNSVDVNGIIGIRGGGLVIFIQYYLNKMSFELS